MARKKKKQNLALKILVGTAKFTGKSIWSVIKLVGKKKPKTIKAKKPKQRPKSIHDAMHLEFNVISTTEGDFQNFTKSLHTRSLIILLFGKRGSGKSTLGFRIMENLYVKGKNCFVLGVKQDLLPKWITEITNLEEVSNGSTVLVDEGAITYSSRQSMKKENIDLGKLLAIARHKDLTLVLVTQNTSMIDKSVLNLADVVMAKEGSLLQKQMERTSIKNFVSKADKAIKKYPSDERVKMTYIFSDDFEGLCEVALPSFWNQNISKSRSV